MHNLQRVVVASGAVVANVWIYSRVLAASGRCCDAEDFTLIASATFSQMFLFQALRLPFTRLGMIRSLQLLQHLAAKEPYLVTQSQQTVENK